MIEAKGLTKYFGPIAAIEDVSFCVNQGEVMGFLGPNGAGKTTTMRILTGFSPASQGTASVGGYDVHASPIEVKRRVGYLPESVPLYGEMVVSTFLAYVATIKGVARPRIEVDRVVERCGLEPVRRRLISNLSKGFRQRVGLAQALIGAPPVLILDEPTVGLDPRQIVEIRQMIRDLAADHTVLLSTHILPEVSMVCERVIIISQGRIVAQDSMANLTGRGVTALAVEVAGPTAKARVLFERLAGVTRVADEGGGRYRLEAAPGADVGPAVARAATEAGLDLRLLQPRTRTLEDVFMDAIATDVGEAS